MRERPEATLAEYETERAALLPNGRLTLEELRRVAEVVRLTEQGSAYDFLDEVIFALCDQLEHSLQPSQTEGPHLEGPDGEGPDGEGSEWRQHTTWAYAEIVELVYA